MSYYGGSSGGYPPPNQGLPQQYGTSQGYPPSQSYNPQNTNYSPQQSYNPSATNYSTGSFFFLCIFCLELIFQAILPRLHPLGILLLRRTILLPIIPPITIIPRLLMVVEARSIKTPITQTRVTGQTVPTLSPRITPEASIPLHTFLFPPRPLKWQAFQYELSTSR